jgi:hypothetical protein
LPECNNSRNLSDALPFGKASDFHFAKFVQSSLLAAQGSSPTRNNTMGKRSPVSGKIELYKGKPEIKVNSPAQISAQ